MRMTAQASARSQPANRRSTAARALRWSVRTVSSHAGSTSRPSRAPTTPSAAWKTTGAIEPRLPDALSSPLRTVVAISVAIGSTDDLGIIRQAAERVLHGLVDGVGWRDLLGQLEEGSGEGRDDDDERGDEGRRRLRAS